MKNKIKLLPKIDNKIHLTNYGYSINKSDRERHKALNKACDSNGILTILKRLNLIRNYQSNSEIKDVFNNDVEYLKRKYSVYKMKPNRNYNKNGDSDNKDNENNEDNKVEMEIEMEIEELSNNNMEDELIISNNTDYLILDIYETHVVDDLTLTFRTLKQQDSDLIKKFSNKNFDETLFTTKLVIGVEKNKTLQGYTVVDYINNDCEIVIYDVLKSFRSALYGFVEKVLSKNNKIRVYVTIDFNKDDIQTEINFWYAMGFYMYAVEREKFTVSLEKFL